MRPGFQVRRSFTQSGCKYTETSQTTRNRGNFSILIYQTQTIPCVNVTEHKVDKGTNQILGLQYGACYFKLGR